MRYLIAFTISTVIFLACAPKKKTDLKIDPPTIKSADTITFSIDLSVCMSRRYDLIKIYPSSTNELIALVQIKGEFTDTTYSTPISSNYKNQLIDLYSYSHFQDSLAREKNKETLVPSSPKRGFLIRSTNEDTIAYQINGLNMLLRAHNLYFNIFSKILNDTVNFREYPQVSPPPIEK